jgi:hypothetical protein
MQRADPAITLRGVRAVSAVHSTTHASAGSWSWGKESKS